MLYQVGPLTFDTFPFSINAAKRSGTADFAKHDLLNRRRGYEFEGPGDDVLILTGECLPWHIGGLSEIELTHRLRDAGDPVFVMRGDGGVAGWHVITEFEDNHEMIAPDGVGFVVKHQLKLERCDDPGSGAGSGLIASLLSLFG